MKIRLCEEKDFSQLAEMRWLHFEEDDTDYNEHNLDGVSKDKFISEFVSFLTTNNDYKIFVVENTGVIISSMFVYMIPKLPKPNGNAKHIAYLTNVFTRKEYRNRNIGTELLNHIKNYLAEQKCELIFVWPSDNSIRWYQRNGFSDINEIFECRLTRE